MVPARSPVTRPLITISRFTSARVAARRPPLTYGALELYKCPLPVVRLAAQCPVTCPAASRKTRAVVSTLTTRRPRRPPRPPALSSPRPPPKSHSDALRAVAQSQCPAACPIAMARRLISPRRGPPRVDRPGMARRALRLGIGANALP